MARTRAVKVLDFACRTEAGTANCERFVEMLGLKTLFPLFMGKVGHDIACILTPGGIQEAAQHSPNI